MSTRAALWLRGWSMYKIGITFIGVLALMGCDSKQMFNYQDQSQKFGATVTYNNKVDILMVVDTSGSMQKHQAELANQMQNFVHSLNQTKLDYNIATITMDMRPSAQGGTGGQFIGMPKVLNTTTPNLVSVLKNRLLLGEEGSTREAGLESILMALSPSYLNGEGKGFLRDEALLSIIVLSNEDDESIESTEHVIDFLNQIKAPFESGQRSWIFNFIGVTELGGSCRTRFNYSSPGLRYLEMAQASNGIVESICEADLSVATKNLKIRITQILTDYKLKYVPDVDSIKVYINSQLILRSQESGWNYIESLNVIRFYGDSVPAADADIQIDYKPSGE